MKKIILLMLMSINMYSQYPIVEEFDPGTTWIFTNGSGIQNYGPPENYSTFNVGITPYPNNSVITITSPTDNFVTSCGVNMTISFPLSGIIQNGVDFMSFQYFNGAIWVTVATYTGIQNATFSYSIPNIATTFRFILTTSPTINSYFTCCPLTNNVYYYDITRFTIDCTVPLPIELESFICTPSDNYIQLNWNTVSELNNKEFKVYKSDDFITWYQIGTIKAKNKPFKYVLRDEEPVEGVTYYRLIQVDYNGLEYEFKAIDCNYSNSVIVEFYDLLGQKLNNEPIDQVYIKKITNNDNIKYLKSVRYE